MRYSRIRRQDKRKKYAILAITVILICCVIYIISAGTLGKLLSSVISPIVGGDVGFDLDNLDENPKLIVPGEDKAEKVTDTITANSISLYCIQMGAFIDIKNAEDYSNTNKNQGGAGYIVEDTYYRVLAVGFKSENDAISVRKQLGEDQIDSQIYMITSPCVTLQITASQSNVDIIKSAYMSWEENFFLLEDILKSLDRNQIEVIAAQNEIQSIIQSLDNKKSEIENMSATHDGNQILIDLLQLFNETIDALGGIISESSSNNVAISSGIKYTYIELIMSYKDYIEHIKG